MLKSLGEAVAKRIRKPGEETIWTNPMVGAIVDRYRRIVYSIHFLGHLSLLA